MNMNYKSGLKQFEKFDDTFVWTSKLLVLMLETQMRVQDTATDYNEFSLRI